MTKIRAKENVAGQFGMDLHDFIKCKSEEESFYDYEIAGMLNVRPSYIGRLRSIYGIKRTNGFSRRFERTYGKGAMVTFKKMIEDQDKSLSDVARHFGFSRQNAWLVYKKIYGCPYTNAYRKKQQKRKDNATNWKKSKKLNFLLKVKEKMSSMNLVSDISKEERGYMIKINGYKLALKCTSKPRINGKKQYFYISNVKRSTNVNYDFLICLCKSKKENIYYIIPRNEMPKQGVSLLPQAGPNESKYARFKEAWHLLNYKKTGHHPAGLMNSFHIP